MKKGLTLLETVISTALITIMIIAISALNLTNIKTDSINRERDEAFNIARGVCEIFKCVKEVIPEKSILNYIDGIDEVSDNLPIILNCESNIMDKDAGWIIRNNIQKKRFALLLETSISQNLNILKVTIISMSDFNSSVILISEKPLEIVQ